VPRFDARIGGEAGLEPGATPFIEVPGKVVAELGPGKRPETKTRRLQKLLDTLR
jgi:hypothetical protein